MIKSLHLANFKAFADTQRIPIRPLTLIFGANSAGKSSILHSFLLANEATRTESLDIHYTQVGGESVDLGGFRQYIHKADATKRFALSFELTPSEELSFFSAQTRLHATMTVGMEHKRDGRTRWYRPSDGGIHYHQSSYG